MPSSERHPLPDIAVGRHPDFGIVATTPTRLAASAWLLNGFDFRPVPGHPDLYALADQQRDGRDRTVQAIAVLRKAHYRVEADAEFDPSFTTPVRAPVRDRPLYVEPDVAFAEHPQLGLVAATSALCTVRGRRLLEEHDWHHQPHLDIYTLPAATDRGKALATVAQTTVAMNRAGLQVAVQPSLARDITARSTPDAAAPRHDASQRRTARTLPVMSTTALATSPARAGSRGYPPMPTPGGPAPAARSADPRTALSRNR